MMTIRHILFPIDFSERCCEAVPFVEAMARQYQAKVTLMSVTEGFYYVPYAEAGGPLVLNSDLVLSDLKNKLDDALPGRFSGLTVQRVADLGDPAQLIVDYAHNSGIDMIMMPSHGYGRFRRFLLGSVTTKVLHDATCPVWTSAHLAEPGGIRRLPYRTILCAIDADAADESATAIKWAGEFARDAGATLRLVYVMQGMKDFPSPPYREELRQEAEARIGRLQEGLAFRAPASVLFGWVDECVREEAIACGADLVVIGRGVIHERFGAWRTRAFGIVREAPCPVISV